MARAKLWQRETRVCPVCKVEFHPHHFRQVYHSPRCQYIAERKRGSAFGRALTMAQAIKWYGESWDMWSGRPRRHPHYMTPLQHHPAEREIVGGEGANHD